MPSVSCYDRKDSAQLSKKYAPGSTSSLGSTDSCFPNYTTSSLGYLDDVSSTASSRARGHSSQTFDTDSAYTNESGESAYKRAPPSDKKIKVKRAVEAPTYGTRLALRMFSGVNQRHGVSYNKKAGVFETPDVKINCRPPASDIGKAPRAEGPLGGVQADEARVKVPNHKEATPKSILLGHSVPTNSGHSTSPQSQQRRPADPRHSNQQASPFLPNGSAPVQRERNTAADEYGDFDRKEMAAFNEVIKHNYSQRGQKVDSLSTKHEDRRSAGASSAQLAPSDRQRPQQKPTSDHPVKASTLPQHGSSRESTTTPTTAGNRSPDNVRTRSPTQRRPDALAARRKSYERRRPNDGAALPARAASPIPGQHSHVQFLHSRQPPPPQPQTQRLVYESCGHPSKRNPRTQYLKPVSPPHAPYPPEYLHKFSALRLPDAILWDIHRAYDLEPVPPPTGDIKLYLLTTYPSHRAEIGKMSDKDVVNCSYIHVIYIVGGDDRTRLPPGVPPSPPPRRETEQEHRERTFSLLDFQEKFERRVKLAREMLAREERERLCRGERREKVDDFRCIETMRRGRSTPVGASGKQQKHQQ